MHRLYRATVCALIVGSTNATIPLAQAPSPDKAIPAAIEQLFAAMSRGDTAAVRRSFLPGGRVVVMPSPDSLTERVAFLALDDFVRFAGQNAPNTWIERLWNPAVRSTGSLGYICFDYDVYRGSSFSHCGINSVQMQQSPSGWKIVSMAFTSRRVGCDAREPPPPTR